MVSPQAVLPPMPRPGYASTANGKIRVPGIWDNQGYGTETDKLRHSFIGKSWYQRQVEIPRSWAGRRVFLKFTGVYRYAKVWIDKIPRRAHRLPVGVPIRRQPGAAPGHGHYHDRGGLQAAVGGGRPVWLCLTGRLHGRGLGWHLGAYTVRGPRRRLAKRPVRAAGRAPFELRSRALNGLSKSVDHAQVEVFDASGRRVAQSSSMPDGRLVAGQPIRIEVPMAGQASGLPIVPRSTRLA